MLIMAIRETQSIFLVESFFIKFIVYSKRHLKELCFQNKTII